MTSRLNGPSNAVVRLLVALIGRIGLVGCAVAALLTIMPATAAGQNATVRFAGLANATPGQGTITVSVHNSTGNTYTETLANGPLSSAASIASGFGALFTRDYLCSAGCGNGLGAQGTVNSDGSGTLNLQMNSGASFGTISVTSTGNVPFQITNSSGSNSPGGPVITSISPNPAEPGTLVTVIGSGFGPDQGFSLLTLNGYGLTPQTWSDAAITFTLPDNAVTGEVVVALVNNTSASIILNVGSPYSSFYLVNPFALGSTDPVQGTSISPATVLAPVPATVQALGIVADATSTAIVVYRTNVPENLTLSVPQNSSALLQYYDPGFLSPSLSATSAPSITILASQFIRNPITGEYSALALLKAPSPSFTGQLTVTGNQTTLVGQTSEVTVIPRPIVMLHGLWGGTSTFSSIAAYLTTPPLPYVDITSGWNFNPTLLAPIYRVCYSKTLAFDNPSNQALGNCSWASEDAINNALTQIYAYLNTERIVGGRVDVLGHSMGGLAARHFAVTPEYLGNRNLQQGSFFSTLSLDTPHFGSALAPFLVGAVANNYLGDDEAGIFGSALWDLVCTPFDTLGSCFSRLGNPVGDAVASLDPAYSGLAEATANPVEIANAMNGQLASEFQDVPQGVVSLATGNDVTGEDDSSLPPVSMQRAMIDAFIQAVDPNLQEADAGVDGILGTYDDDAVVTVSSQFAGYGGGSPFEFTDHSGVGGFVVFEVLNALFNSAALKNGLVLSNPFSDNNVMESPDVNAFIVCWLASFTACPSVISQTTNHVQRVATTLTAAAVGDPHEKKPNVQTASQKTLGQRHSMPNADDNLTLFVPAAPLILAQAYDLRMDTKANRLTSVYVTQSTQLKQSDVSEIVERSMHPVQHHANGEAFVKIIPLRLGTISISVAGIFPDGRASHQTIAVQVEEGPSPKTLRAGNGFSPDGDFPVIDMRLKNPVGNTLSPNATYDGVKESIVIDPRFAKFKVMTLHDQQIISLDPSTGAIKPLKIGHALVETSFGGLSSYTCIDVVERDDQRPTHTKCEELLPPGVKLSGSR